MTIHIEKRNAEMVRLWEDGSSMGSLVDKYGISQQRIHQILKHRQDLTLCPNGCDRTLPLEPVWGRCCSHCDPSVMDTFNHTYYCDKRKGVKRKYYAWFDSDAESTVHRIEAVSAEEAARLLRVMFMGRGAAVLVVDSSAASLQTKLENGES